MESERGEHHCQSMNGLLSLVKVTRCKVYVDRESNGMQRFQTNTTFLTLVALRTTTVSNFEGNKNTSVRLCFEKERPSRTQRRHKEI